MISYGLAFLIRVEFLEIKDHRTNAQVSFAVPLVVLSLKLWICNGRCLLIQGRPKEPMKCELVLLASAASLLLVDCCARSLTNASAVEDTLTKEASATLPHVITDPQELAIAAFQLQSLITAPPSRTSGSGHKGIVISAGGEHLLSNAYVTAKVCTITVAVSSITSDQTFCTSVP